MSNEELEIFNQVTKRIPKHYDIYLNRVLEVLGYDKLTTDNVLPVVKYLNNSNTKLSPSYWVLRQGYSTEDAELKSSENKEEFVKISYSKQSRSEVANKFIKNNNSRGYSGWVNFGDYDFFVRSIPEFIYIHWLCSKYDPKYIKYETSYYTINGINYKPDFFIVDEDGKIIKIYEVKHDKSFRGADRYLDILDHMDNIAKIEYELLDSHRDYLTPELSKKLDIWKKTAHIKTDFSGEKNPRYGIKCTDETKRLISLRAIERNKDPAYKEKVRNRPKISEETRQLQRLVAIERNAKRTPEQKMDIVNKGLQTRKVKYYSDKKCSGGCKKVKSVLTTTEYICNTCHRKRVLKGISGNIRKGMVDSFIKRWVDEVGVDEFNNLIFDNFEDKIKERKRELYKPNLKVSLNQILLVYDSLENLKIKIKEMYSENFKDK